MLKATSVKNALNSAGPMDSILINGWVRTRRDAKAFSFIEINDGSCLKNLQVIADAGLAGYAEVVQKTHDWCGGIGARKTGGVKRGGRELGGNGRGR